MGPRHPAALDRTVLVDPHHVSPIDVASFLYTMEAVLVEGVSGRREAVLPVPFHGDGGGVEELSWGQWELWEGLHRLRTWMPISFVQPLPPGASVATVAGQLRFMMERYQSMRTRLVFEAGEPRQEVTEAGEIGLAVVDADTAEDPAKVAEQVEQRLRETDYDFCSQWPVRMAVIRHHGVPTHQVMVVCHLVTDAAGAAVIARDLAGRDPRSGVAATPPATAQPLAQARWQRSPAGQRQARTALRYWEDLLRTIPAQRFPRRREPRSPRYWQLGFESPATHLAVRAIARRAGVDTAPVLLTVFCVALARQTGVNPVATRVIVDNRFRPGFADVVGPLAQAGLLVVDLGGLTFEEALARTRRRAMVGYKYAHFDAARVYELVDQVSRDRGERIHLGCFFNDRRSSDRQLTDDRQRLGGPAGKAPPAELSELLQSARRRTCLRWERQQDEPFEELFLHVNDVPDTLDLTALSDTRYLSPDDVESLLYGMEEAAVAAALDPTDPAGAAPGGRR